MSRGILELLGSAATLIFALPLALAGGELLLRGHRFVGVGLLGIALVMVVVDHYVTGPGDLPELVASKLVGAVVQPPEEE